MESASLKGVALLLAALLAAPVMATPLSPVRLLEMQRIEEFDVSADGRRLAYVLVHTDVERNRRWREIRVRTLDGDEDVRWQTQAWRPRWSGDSLLYLSRDARAVQVWRQASATARPQALTSVAVDVERFAVGTADQPLLLQMRVRPSCGEDLACSAKADAGSRTRDQLMLRHGARWDDGRRAAWFCAPAGERPWLASRPAGDPGHEALDEDPAFDASGALIYAARPLGHDRAWSTRSDLWRTSCGRASEPHNLTPDSPGADTSPVVAGDGQVLFWRSQLHPGRESDRWRLMRRDLRSGATRERAPGWDRSVLRLWVERDLEQVWLLADDLGDRAAFRLAAGSTTPARRSPAGSVEDIALSAGGPVALFSRVDAPPQLERWDGDTTRPLVDIAQAAATLSPPLPFHFEGAGGERVHGRVLPPASGTGRPAAVVLMIHGGPQQSMGNRFGLRWNPQVLSARGYAVVEIDYHGSTGYGQAFTDSASGDWGGKPLRDLQLGWKAALARFEWLDGGRACLLGASYGGYLVFRLLGEEPDGFQCAISHAGIVDVQAWAMTTDELWFAQRELGGPPFDGLGRLAALEPLARISRWKTPTLVIHGGRDYRVPETQGIAAFTALQRRGIDSRFLHFPLAGHWVDRPRDARDWYESVLAWLDQHLAPTP